ncbi:sensor histidine kinase [Hymenobacter sp.]|uniref:sensor histidine kinase n=1 Tax=Hymenobacter sp. TaxID=1898978 RepID=UPI002ED95DD6
MTIRQLIELYNRQPALRVAGHGLFWALLWLFTENPDTPLTLGSRLLEWGYSLAAFYLLFYWVVPRLWFRRRYVLVAVVLLGLILGSGEVMYWLEKLNNPDTDYAFVTTFDKVGVLTIFQSGRYFFYAAFNGLLGNIVGPGVVKVAKMLYERQISRHRTEQLTRRLQLEVLLSQVSPHFLFNTLNNLYGLVLQADPRARTITHQLAALMRYTDELAGREWVTLREEINFIEDFLALARLRYGQQATIESHWDLGPDAVALPPLLLLPLVENAFKHGLSQALGAAWVRVEARVTVSAIELRVANSQLATPVPTVSQPGGLGLTTMRERLHLLYPGPSPLVLHATPTTFVATLQLPLRAAPRQVVSSFSSPTIASARCL